MSQNPFFSIWRYRRRLLLGLLAGMAAWLVLQVLSLPLAAVTGRSETGRRLHDLYPRYSVPLKLKELEESDRDDVEAHLLGLLRDRDGGLDPLVLGRGAAVGRIGGDVTDGEDAELHHDCLLVLAPSYNIVDVSTIPVVAPPAFGFS